LTFTLNSRFRNRLNDHSPCGIALRTNDAISVESVFHEASRKGAKHAKLLENREISFFAVLAQPKADPSSGGLWRSLEAKNFVDVVLFNVPRENH